MSDELKVITSDKDAVECILEKEKISKTDFAKMMGWNRQYVNQIMNRNSGGVRFDTFMKIMDQLGYEVCIRKVES